MYLDAWCSDESNELKIMRNCTVFTELTGEIKINKLKLKSPQRQNADLYKRVRQIQRNKFTTGENKQINLEMM